MKINIGVLAVKIAITLVAAVISFMFLEANPLPQVLGLTLVVALVNYFVGLLFAKHGLGNFITNVAKGLLAILVAWVIGGLLMPDFTITTSAQITFGILITGLELFF